jgi:DNA primase
MSVIEEVKARIDIVDFIGGLVPLKKSGRHYKGLCPFHVEKTPSFVVFPEAQTWRCFGACGEGGDIFTFVMKREGWDFGEALRYLAEKAGVELQAYTPQQAEEAETHQRLRDLLADAALHFANLLLNAPQAGEARAYVERRGLWPETVASFGLGYAPEGWYVTRDTLLERGYQLDDLIEAGLLVQKDDGSTYDRFRNRLMIPIRDVRGRVIGFGARALAADDQPKYLNSPQGPLFDKSRTLFGLSHARRAMRESETAVIVEGYMDVMQAHQAGFGNVIAQMGTALTEPQLRLLKRYARRIILALDADVAGAAATLRGVDMARATLDHHIEPVFDARGFVRYESRLGADVRVSVLPQGTDPDDLIRQNPDAWAELLDGALPVVEYAILLATEGQDLDDPKVKARLAREMRSLIDDVADPVERDHYRQRVARLLRVPERALLLEAGRRGTRPALQDEPQPDQPPPDDNVVGAPPRLEEFVLGAMLRLPTLAYQADRLLAEVLDPVYLPEPLPGCECFRQHVSYEDFTHPAHRALLAAWHTALAQADMEPLDHLYAALDEALTARLVAVLEVCLPAPANEETRLIEEALRRMIELRKARLAEHIQELQFLLQDADQTGDLTADQYQATIIAHITARARLECAQQRYTLTGKRWALTSHEPHRRQTRSGWLRPDEAGVLRRAR